MFKSIMFWNRWTAALALISLTQCVSVPTPNLAYSPATHATWVRYLKLSPLSNPTPSAAFSEVASAVRGLPREGVDVLVQDHLTRVARMLSTFPSVQREAESAASQARKDMRRWKPAGEFVGERLAVSDEDEDTGPIGHAFNEKFGGALGGLFVEAMAESSASSARARVLRHFREEMEILVTNESALNAKLGYPNSTMMNQWCRQIAASRSGYRPSVQPNFRVSYMPHYYGRRVRW